MLVVDTHVHASPYWFEPIEVLLFQMNAQRVDKATLVQFFGQTDNRYIFECARRFPGRFSPVVAVDTEGADVPRALKQLASEGAEGVRLRPTTRSPGEDPLAIWRVCAELGLAVSCGGSEEEFASDDFRKLVEALPDLPVIVEHLGHPQHDKPPYPVYQKVLALARYPNTYIKLGGLGEICERPFPFADPFYSVHGVPPFIKMAYEAFGASRMMWGSNYPPCSRLEGYANTLRLVEEYLTGFCSQDDKQWIFGKTALLLYKFRQ
ncbi:MAG: amidohydrolase [Chloroflexi bacterium]|nr:amidohydrolase [Chloroflexota bacterium]